MEKTSLVIGFNGGEATVIACGDVDECSAAYRKEIDADKFEFVGMLRKPAWYKRGKPGLVQKQKEEAHAALKAELEKANEKAVEAIADAGVLENKLENAEAPKKKVAKKKATK